MVLGASSELVLVHELLSARVQILWCVELQRRGFGQMIMQYLFGLLFKANSTNMEIETRLRRR